MRTSRIEFRIEPRQLRRAVMALLLAGLAGCSANGRYYVQPDLSPAGIEGVSGLTRAVVPMSPLELGVTFKSDGKVLAPAGDALYRMVHDDLGKRGGWNVRRIGRQGDDFAPLIANLSAAPAAAAMAQPPATPQVPRMIMLVEDVTDRSGATRVDYFLSGMSIGLYGVRKAVDHYDVTIAYRDPYGVQRIYHSHQELLYGNGSGSRRNDPVPPELKRYDNVLAAFDRVVYDSISGSRHGVATVGQPQFVPRSGSR
jgi:hypothetical protein